MPKKVYLRADGSPGIGMGHFTRCLALADILKDRFECTYVTLNPSALQINELKKSEIECIILNNPDTHFIDFLNILTGDEIVVLDNYYFTPDYQLEIKAKGCKLVCIDDNHDKHYFANIVLNHSPSVRDEMFSREHHTRLLLGLDYVLLRKDFLLEAKNSHNPRNSREVLVCFGGSDMPDNTRKILDIIKDHADIDTVHVILGSAYQHPERISQRSGRKPWIKVYQNLAASEIIQIARSSALAIVPSSTLLLEMISVGIPVITGYFVNNQIEMASEIAIDKNGIFDVGNLNKLNKNNITSLISKTLKLDLHKIKKVQSGLIDGNSDRRISDEFDRL